MRFFFFFKENIPSPFPLHNVRGSDGRSQRPWDFSPQASILSKTLDLHVSPKAFWALEAKCRFSLPLSSFGAGGSSSLVELDQA